MAQEKKSSPAMEGVKRSLGKAADMTSLKFKLSQAKTKRKNAYTRLGELTYAKARPRQGDVPAEIESAITAAITEITELTHLIVELELRVKLLKADA